MNGLKKESWKLILEVNMSSRNKYKIDWVTAATWLVLCLLGWFSIYSAAYNPEYDSIFSFKMSYGKQLMWIGVSALLGGVILLSDSMLIKNSSLPVYGTVVLLLIAVLLFGTVRGGARSWFGIGSFGIQPSEFSKVAISLLLAHYLSNTKDAFKKMESKLKALGIIAIPAGLILLQPDTGTVLILFAFILVMYREGLSGTPLVIGVSAVILAVTAIISIETKTDIIPGVEELSGVWILLGILVLLSIATYILVYRLALPRFRKKFTNLVIISSVAALAFVGSIDYVFNSVLKKYQADRIRTLLQLEVQGDKWADWNIKNSKTAIGNGGALGQGYLDGPITKYRFVPEQYTDFIFCTIGEEWGYLGSLTVLGLFTFLIIRLIIMAERQRSSFSRIFGYSVACILFMHVFINIGMVIGLAPVIGIPLPFFSYGGSSMMAFTVMLFIFIKLDSERLVVLR